MKINVSNDKKYNAVKPLALAISLSLLSALSGCNGSKTDDGGEQSQAGVATYSFDNSDYQASESETSVVITVNRSGNTTQYSTVNYSVSAGSASSGADFIATTGQLNWTANDTSSKSFTVSLLSDAIVESDETVALKLTDSATGNVLSNSILTIKDSAIVSCTELQDTSIDTDRTLNSSCYKIENDIYVEGGATLTINPGVKLRFASGKRLTIRSDGALNAVGTESSPIVFTGTQATPGYWDGISYYNSNNLKNEFKYVTVEYGGGIGANLALQSETRMKISHSTLRKSSAYGLKIDSGVKLDQFDNNILTANEGAPIHIPADKIGKLDSASVFSGNAANKNYISIPDSTTVLTDQTWNALDVPYKLKNINLEALLRINPNTTLVFKADGNFRIEKDGTLIAKGTQTEKITFTAEQTTPGYWHGLQFTFSGTANELEHVKVDYAGGTSGNGEGAITLFSTPGRLKLHNSSVSNSLGYGLDFTNPKHIIDVKNINLTNNEKGSVFINPDIVSQLDYASNYNDPIVLANGGFKSDQTIKSLGVPYHLGSHYIFSSLIIEAGTKLVFAAGGGLKTSNQGSLSAIGTDSQPIIFTGQQQISGYWSGIQFLTNSVSNKLDHTVVEYGGQPGGNAPSLVGMFFNDSRADISNSILRHSATNGIWQANATAGSRSNISFSDIANEEIHTD